MSVRFGMSAGPLRITPACARASAPRRSIDSTNRVEQRRKVARTRARLRVALEAEGRAVGDRRCPAASRRTASGASARTFGGSVASSTAKPWFWLEMKTRPVSRSITGWFAPWWPNFIFTVRAPAARPSSWWPRQMPKIGTPASRNARIASIAYVQGSGSPGPFDRKTPSGTSASTSAAGVCAGTTVMRQPWSASRRRMLRLMPKS